MRTAAAAIISGILIVGWGRADAQMDSISPPRLAVRWSPFNMGIKFPTLQIGAEHQLRPDLSISYDLGVVLQYRNQQSERYSNRSGMRALVDIRYYLNLPTTTPFYLAVEAYMHRIRFDRSEVIGYNCVDGNCDYFEYATWRRKFDRERLALKAGILIFPPVGKGTNFYFDISGGVSVNFSRRPDINPPDPLIIQVFNRWDSPFRGFEESGTSILPVLSFRTGYRIR